MIVIVIEWTYLESITSSYTHVFPVGSVVVREKKKTIFILSIPFSKGKKIPYQYMNTNKSYGYDIVIRL